MKRISLTVLFFALSTVIFGLSKGEHYFQKGQFSEAAIHYRKQLEQDPNSPTLLYNLGTCYWKSGELGEALTFYYKAQVFDPLDVDLRYNITLLESKVINREQPPFSLVRTLSVLSPSIWAFSSLTLLLMTLLLIVFYNHHRHRRFTLVFAIISTLWLLLGMTYFYHREFHSYGVIIAPKVAVYSGPSSSLEIMFFIHEGIRIETLKQVNGWHQISLDNTLTGWIKDDSYWRL